MRCRSGNHPPCTEPCHPPPNPRFSPVQQCNDYRIRFCPSLIRHEDETAQFPRSSTWRWMPCPAHGSSDFCRGGRLLDLLISLVFSVCRRIRCRGRTWNANGGNAVPVAVQFIGPNDGSRQSIQAINLSLGIGIHMLLIGIERDKAIAKHASKFCVPQNLSTAFIQGDHTAVEPQKNDSRRCSLELGLGCSSSEKFAQPKIFHEAL